MSDETAEKAFRLVRWDEPLRARREEEGLEQEAGEIEQRCEDDDEARRGDRGDEEGSRQERSQKQEPKNLACGEDAPGGIFGAGLGEAEGDGAEARLIVVFGRISGRLGAGCCANKAQRCPDHAANLGQRCIP